jgi:hypothetical protein
MRLADRDLKMMNRLVRAQSRRMEPAQSGGGATVVQMPLAQPLSSVGIHLPVAAIV